MTRTTTIVILGALAACRSDSDLQVDPPVDASLTVDGAIDSGRADAAVDPDDGPAMRRACTSSFGTALSASYGRLDGFLVSIVSPGSGGCRADSTHLHLQIEMAGETYDVAVNVGGDVLVATRDEIVDGAVWSEGWHPSDGIDYTALGVHADDIATSASVTAIEADLATTNHISIYATGYDDTGAHLVHRNNGFDGAIVTHVLSDVPHVRMFRFTDQSF
jgi:hypothetical protein